MDVTGISIAEATRIEHASIVGARINDAGQLILKKGDGVTEFNAGQVVPNSWPVGSIFIHTSPDNPAQLLALPNSTWERYGKGRALVSVEEGSPEFGGSGATFGEKKHTQTVAEMANHSHTNTPHSHTSDPHTHAARNNNASAAPTSAVVGSDAKVVAAGGSFYAATDFTGQLTIDAATVNISTNGIAIQASGSSTPFNVIQPSIAVYVWRRTG